MSKKRTIDSTVLQNQAALFSLGIEALLILLSALSTFELDDNPC